MFHGNCYKIFHLILGILFWSHLPATRVSSKQASFGDDVNLQCRFPNSTFPNTASKLKWFKNKQVLRNREGKRTIRRNGRVLRLMEILQRDAGVYSCIDTARSTIIVTYNVSVEQHSLQRKLRFKSHDTMMRQRNIAKPAGNDITFDCAAVGIGPVRYKWFKGGEPLLSRRVDSNLVLDKPQLKLKHLMRSDSASYKCVAENKYGNISSNMVLYVYEVRATPYIEKATMKNQTRYVGENVSIVCYGLITGTIPDFRWLKWTGALNEAMLKKTYHSQETWVGSVDKDIAHVIHGDFYRPIKKYVTVESHGRAVVHGVKCLLFNVKREDSGFYTCIASNWLGTDYASMHLDIRDREEAVPYTPVMLNNNSSMQVIIAVLGVLVLISFVIMVWLFVTWKLKGHRNPPHNDLALESLARSRVENEYVYI